MMRATCDKCKANQVKAGEALELFNEAMSELQELGELLRALEDLMGDQGDRDELDAEGLALLARVRDARAHLGERRRVENAVREIISPT